MTPDKSTGFWFAIAGLVAAILNVALLVGAVFAVLWGLNYYGVI